MAAQQASTLGQERILKTSSSELINDLQDRVIEFTRGVVTHLAFYQYTNPNLSLPLTMRVPGISEEIPFTWEPRHRNSDFFN